MTVIVKTKKKMYKANMMRKYSKWKIYTKINEDFVFMKDLQIQLSSFAYSEFNIIVFSFFSNEDFM
jgi:hypothetical protein